MHSCCVLPLGEVHRPLSSLLYEVLHWQSHANNGMHQCSHLLELQCRTEKGFFCNTFFNSTVDVVDQPRFVDTQLLFLGVIALGVLGVIGKPPGFSHAFS